jgi:hypothetical protein
MAGIPVAVCLARPPVVLGLHWVVVVVDVVVVDVVVLDLPP